MNRSCLCFRGLKSGIHRKSSLTVSLVEVIGAVLRDWNSAHYLYQSKQKYLKPLARQTNTCLLSSHQQSPLPDPPHTRLKMFYLHVIATWKSNASELTNIPVHANPFSSAHHPKASCIDVAGLCRSSTALSDERNKVYPPSPRTKIKMKRGIDRMNENVKKISFERKHKSCFPPLFDLQP